MSEPGSGQIVSSHLLKLVLGVVSLIAFAMLACNGSGDGSLSSPAAPPGMFSTLPTSEPPVLGDQPPTVELNTPEPTLAPQPTPTPNPTYTPVPTPTPLPTPTATPQPTHTPQPTYTPVPLPTSTPYPTATPNPTASTGFTCSNESGPPPLHQSVIKVDLEVAAILAVLCPEHLNIKYGYGFRHDETPLSLAVKARSTEMVRILADAGADPNTVTQIGFRHYETPLSLAVKAQASDIVRILVDAGADPNKETQNDFRVNVSPLDIAIEKGYTDIVKILTRTSQ